MRKLWASLLAISFFIAIFYGCSTQSRVEVKTEFEAECKVEVNDIELCLDVLSASGENITVKVISPDNFKGLTYERVNSDLYIVYNGLKCTTCADYLTSYNPFDILIDSLICAKTAELSYMHEEGDYAVYKGKSENGEYNLYIDRLSGDIKKLKPLYAQYEFEFS